MDAALDRFEQRPIVERLLEEGKRAPIEGTDPCRRVVESTDEDDRQASCRRQELILKLQSVESRKLHIEDEAHGVVGVLRAQEILGAGEAHRRITGGGDQPLESPQDRPIIINDADHGDAVVKIYAQMEGMDIGPWSSGYGD